jgi:cytochrome c-type biogenesis protein CcmH
MMLREPSSFCLDKLFILVMMVCLLSTLIAVREAQASTPSDDEVNRIASQLFCPICDNMPLDVCPIEACQQWRELIRDQLAEGWSEAEIKAYFVAQYGDRVLGEPPRTGLNWLLYLAPPR